MNFEDMRVGRTVLYNNVIPAQIVDIDTNLNPAFRVQWEGNYPAHWYPAASAVRFSPVPVPED